MITYEKARDYCVKAHGEQMYAELLPYSFHLDAAVEVALRFGITDRRIILAILGHDVIEDTRRKIWQMAMAGFPVRSLRMIWLVTDKAGATRDERKANTLPGIRQDQDAVIVKLCDRIANVEFGIRNHEAKLARHVAEYAFFRACMYDPRHIKAQKMWLHLDALLGWKPQ